MAAQPRQLHLNAFLRNIGQHEAAWRLPETRISGITDIDHYIDLARIAERGKLDAIFIADHPVLKARPSSWARVLDNVTLGLSGPDVAQRGSTVLADVGLPGREGAWPYELANNNASRWPARWCATRRCCWPMNRSARLTR